MAYSRCGHVIIVHNFKLMSSSSKVFQEVFNTIKTQMDNFDKQCESTCKYNTKYSSHECFTSCAELTNKRTESLVVALEAASSYSKTHGN